MGQPAIIQQLEQASAGSRELDALIFCAVLHPDKKPTRNFHYTNKDEWGVFVSNQPKPGTTFYDAPHYTTSLDAALTLVPEGFYTEGAYEMHWKPVNERWDWHLMCYDLTKGHLGTSATPTLALCIACLRAREQNADN